MRSGWPHTQDGQGMYPEQERRAPFGPDASWPAGYSDPEYRDGDYRYGAQQPAAQSAGQPPATARGAVGEHPYAAFNAAGYGDDGYRDPGYQGPAAQDLGVPGTRTVRGFVEPRFTEPQFIEQGQFIEQAQPPGGYLRDGYPGPDHPSGAYPVQSFEGYREIEIAYPPSSGAAEAYHGADSYKQPWDYDQPLRYDDGEVYPVSPDGHGQAGGYDASSYQPQGHEPAGYNGSGYNGSDYSMPGIDGPGYDLSGIIRTSDFEAVGYDQPGYDRLAYDDPRYADAADYRDGGQRFQEPGFQEPGFQEPGFDETRFSDTRFDVPRFDETRLDNLWLAADDVREESAPSGYSGDGFGGTAVRSEYRDFDQGMSRRFDETRTDMRALEADYTRFDVPAFDETRIDNLRAFSTGSFAAVADTRPAAAALLAPPATQPRSWMEDTSLDHFADLDLTDEPVPAAFTRASLTTLEDRPEADDTASRRAVGRRRGRSSDKRQWMALGAIAVVAAGAIGGVLMKYVFPKTGPAHEVVAVQSVDGYTRSATLGKEMNVSSLAQSVAASSSGQASDVVSAVYQQGTVMPGSNPQIFMFVGGKLASADPSASVANFEQSYPDAHAVSAGSLGGQAACTESKVNGQEAAMCVWFDNDTFGAVVSSTMTTGKLATTLDQVRPALELYAK